MSPGSCDLTAHCSCCCEFTSCTPINCEAASSLLGFLFNHSTSFRLQHSLIDFLFNYGQPGLCSPQAVL